MSEIHFLPWVGQYYGKENFLNKKVMVLGESVHCGHRCSPCDGCPNFTIGCVLDHLNDNVYDEQGKYQKWANTYKKFESALIGRKLLMEERPLAWDAIVFYNYFQTALDFSRQPLGGNIEYNRAAECLMSMLQEYEPDRVIVWGRRLWNHLPNINWFNRPTIEHDGIISPTGYYLINGKEFPFMLINHPSSGFSWDIWHKNIKEFLEN